MWLLEMLHHDQEGGSEYVVPFQRVGVCDDVTEKGRLAG